MKASRVLLLAPLLAAGCDQGAYLPPATPAPLTARPPADPAPAATAPAPATAATAPAPATASPPPGAPPAAGAAREAAAYSFDGFKLGTLYGSSVMTRAPYSEPCDNDPIDQRSRRFMVYGARPCRDRSFPEGTTVAFYLAYAEGEARYNQPIVAFAWLGGGYFTRRSDFPLHTGQPAAAAAAAFGSPVSTLTLRRKEHRLTVQHHRGDVFALVDDGLLVGFVVGPMPDDPDNEQWRGLMQMYVRYTKA